jgi:hypothetical protein
MDLEMTIREVVQQLEQMPRVPTTFESSVLATVRRFLDQGRLPSPKQQAILCQMCDEYLHDLLLAAELRGQLRLLV